MTGAGAGAWGLSGLTGPVRRSVDEADVLGGTVAAPETASALSRLSGAGSPLPDSVAGQFGEAMGADLSAVRIHDDPEADRISRSMQATAFTHGNDVYFTQGAYSPATAGGQRLLAHELAHVTQQQSGVQRSASVSGPVIGLAADPAEADADAIADSALERLRQHASGLSARPAVAEARVGGLEPLRRQAAPAGGSAVLRRKIVMLGKAAADKVEVATDEEEAEARALVDELLDTYGIDLSSATTVAAIDREYKGEASKRVRNKVKESVWQVKELRAIRDAAVHYGPILGAEREKSSQAGRAQGLTTVGKVNTSIDDGKLDPDTQAETFRKKKNVGLFDSATDDVVNEFARAGSAKADNATTLEAIAIHEMAHALIQPRQLKRWVSKMSYWLDEDTPSGKKGAEAPPTGYGKSTAAEDLCESVAVFFVNRPKLKADCPKREAFVAAVVAGWTPKAKAEAIETAASGKGTEPAPSGDKQLVGAAK
ncbi:DUF4157 domain-containing protein [Cellulomonas sp. URHD0024]|uniref:eCIS core domain-containing protein n=1 Tax=Cellulomonas sp. URHD0024 TaxID=1302620 RepID=UPI000427D356|nr:DUF4157 domain-containing protein [Cellulomonas sp. URHD0024]